LRELQAVTDGIRREVGSSLGMKFVPVPGTGVLFGVWGVRANISAPDFSDMLFKKSRISFCVAPYLKLRVLRGQESFSHSPAKHSSSFAEATADKPANGLFFQA
jgi:hypothetical protein